MEYNRRWVDCSSDGDPLWRFCARRPGFLPTGFRSDLGRYAQQFTDAPNRSMLSRMLGNSWNFGNFQALLFDNGMSFTHVDTSVLMARWTTTLDLAWCCIVQYVVWWLSHGSKQSIASNSDQTVGRSNGRATTVVNSSSRAALTLWAANVERSISSLHYIGQELQTKAPSQQDVLLRIS